MSYGFKQMQIQAQVQVMSQKQIQSLQILSYSSQELEKHLYSEIQNNPALVVQDTPKNKKKRFYFDYTKLSKGTSLQAQEASEKFQQVLEAQTDNRETLQQHLITQLNMMRIPPAEKKLTEKVIYNLDTKGYHILSPVSLLDKKNKTETPGLLEKCIENVRQMEPSGVCVKNAEESLLVQATQKDNSPLLALFILDGKLNFLDPPRPEKICKKVLDYQKEQKNLFASKKEKFDISELDITEELCEQALNFIKKLNPFPASHFSTQETHFVKPDVFIEKINDQSEIKKEDHIVSVLGHRWKIIPAFDSMPEITLNQELLQLKSEKKDPELAKKIKQAKDFLDSLEFRRTTILRAVMLIVEKQAEFFISGPGHLNTLKQQDIADLLNVHETTISRMANSKFIQCEWGMFDIKYFFVNSASVNDSSISKDKAIHEIMEILNENTSEKKLSDQKICDILKERGITISRRTVAKYRSQLNIQNSYTR